MTTLVLSWGTLPAAAMEALGSGWLVVEVAPGLGGAWTERRGAHEVTRFGCPESPVSRWLDPASSPGGRHNALSLALERMVHARGIRLIGVADERLRPAAGRAVAAYGTLVWVENRGAAESMVDFLLRLAQLTRRPGDDAA